MSGPHLSLLRQRGNTMNRANTKSNPKFERRHYEAVAQLLGTRYKRSEYNPAGQAYVKLVMLDFVELFKQDNSKFDVQRFAKAAGL